MVNNMGTKNTVKQVISLATEFEININEVRERILDLDGKGKSHRAKLIGEELGRGRMSKGSKASYRGI
jgi:hypothetical protein